MARKNLDPFELEERKTRYHIRELSGVAILTKISIPHAELIDGRVESGVNRDKGTRKAVVYRKTTA
jgi:hypothetical protein